MPLSNRAIVVTGAARGVGRGIAEALAEAGARLVLGDLDEGVHETSRLVAERGAQARALYLDVTDSDSVSSVIAEALEVFGRLDGWVNNAGTLRMNAAVDVSADDFELQDRVNVRALFVCCQAAARQMIRAGRGGTIVNVASNAGKVGYPNMAVYNANKAAVISLTRSLSVEWAPHGINVNAVCPGGVETTMLSGVADWLAARTGVAAGELLAQMKPRQLDRLVQPIEVGRVVAFLLSDAAHIIRGQAINVDGGDAPY